MNLDSLFSAKPDLESLLGRTSVMTLVNPSTGKTVFLVGVQHIGTPEYYLTIRPCIEQTDWVLYELLDRTAENSTSAPKNDPYRDLAQKINNHLEKRIVISQGDGIDYGNPPKNWRKADLSYQEVQMMLSEYLPKYGDKGDGMKRFKAVLDFFAEFSKRRENKLLAALEGFDSDCEVKKIGILYGEGHLPKVEQNLIEKGYKKTDSKLLQPIPEEYHSRKNPAGFSPLMNFRLIPSTF
ncbi:hypothetical protein HYU13_04630 [Candidatus Woesearchaeota archaeon]|nr:hypothetical protein [Candidatus Woesearchaeota archaeon]